MKRRKIVWLLGIALGVILLGVSQDWAQPKPEVKTPVIANAYLIPQGRYGDALKIYIEADDPNNGMLKIATVVEQPGAGRHRVDWVYLKPQYSGHFVGYLQWNTFSRNTGSLQEWTNITIKVSVLDKAGNESNVVVFPFEFVSEVVQNPPPPAPFNVASLPRLGHVMVNLTEPGRTTQGAPPSRN